MIVTLGGALKNVGDYLIGARAESLLAKFVDDEIVSLSRFESLNNEKLEIINKSKALMLRGGPAYTPDVFPNIYPLEEWLDKIKAPIIPYGVGWCGKPFHRPDEFEFTSASISFLNDTHNQIAFSSCRDVLTEGILHKAGYKNVIMTGCPAWYHLDYIGEKMRIAQPMRKIVVTTPANRALVKQTVEVLKAMVDMFPKAEIYLSFHRGILPDKQTGMRNALAYMRMALGGLLNKVKVVDVSYSLDKIEFYTHCDLHVGYRVHAHLYFLSKRLPSILINEDGRGLGMVKSMNLPELNYDNSLLIADLKQVIENYENTNYEDFHRVATLLDNKFEDMKRFLESVVSE